MEKWKECLRHGPPWKALIWKFAQPEGSKMQLKDLRAKWSVANWLWNEFYTRKCLHLHLHHLLRPFSTYPRQWVSQWLIVSDWRLISHLQDLRACFILSEVLLGTIYGRKIVLCDKYSFSVGPSDIVYRDVLTQENWPLRHLVRVEEETWSDEKNTFPPTYLPSVPT